MGYNNNEIFQLLVKGAVKSLNLSEALTAPLIENILNALSEKERNKILQRKKDI